MSPKRPTNFRGGPQAIKLNHTGVSFKNQFRFKNSQTNKEQTFQKTAIPIQNQNDQYRNTNTFSQSTQSLMSISLPNVSQIDELKTQSNSNYPSNNNNDNNHHGTLAVASTNKSIYNPQINIFNNRRYSGPYSINCMMNARRYLIEKFSPLNTGMILQDRLSKDDFEMLKFKLNIPSIFDKDPSKIEMCKNIRIKIRNDIMNRFSFVTARIRDESIYKNLQTIKNSVCEETICDSGKIINFSIKFFEP
jgi:hypothetical protein